MKRVEIEIRTARINVTETLKMIETDILDNQHEVIHRRDYYTTKYRGDILNDVNVGIFLNDNLETVIQIYVSNGFTSIRKRFIMNKDGRTIDKETVTVKEVSFEKLVKVYDDRKLDDKVKEIKKEFLANNPQYMINETLIHYPSDKENYILEFKVV